MAEVRSRLAAPVEAVEMTPEEVEELRGLGCVGDGDKE